jgi:hypothetical protein
MASVCICEVSAAERLRLRPEPAAKSRRDLTGLDDQELLALPASLPASSQTRAVALDLLVGRCRQLLRSCVQRYSRSSVPVEDLMQVGYVGLVMAINNFNPALGFTSRRDPPAGRGQAGDHAGADQRLRPCPGRGVRGRPVSRSHSAPAGKISGCYEQPRS